MFVGLSPWACNKLNISSNIDISFNSRSTELHRNFHWLCLRHVINLKEYFLEIDWQERDLGKACLTLICDKLICFLVGVEHRVRLKLETDSATLAFSQLTE